MSTARPTLLELQLQIRRAVLAGDVGEIPAAIEASGIDAGARLRIYRNHFVATLGEALKTIFPVVCRLVDERFFAYAAHEYLSKHPPRSRCLSEYGADFAEFVASFEPCNDLPYLADVTRFEWEINATARMPEAPPLSPAALAAMLAERAPYVAFRLQPSVRYFTSSWPVDAIWYANQRDEVLPIDLVTDEIRLEIRRAGDTVVWRRLDTGAFAFRSVLAHNHVFAAAIAAATSVDPKFDPAAALQLFLAEGLAVDFGFSPEAV
jgi:hypothetical protein